MGQGLVVPSNSKWISDKILTTGPLRPCLMWDRSGDGPMGPIEPRGPGCPGGPGIPGKPGLPFGPGEPVIKEELVRSTSHEDKGLWLPRVSGSPLQPFLRAICHLPSDVSKTSYRHFQLNMIRILHPSIIVVDHISPKTARHPFSVRELTAYFIVYHNTIQCLCVYIRYEYIH